MRRLVGLVTTALLVAGGCSVIFDGHDLEGRPDGSAGDGDMSGGGGGGGGGGGDGGGGGSGSDDMAHHACTALTKPPTLTPKSVNVIGNMPNRIATADMDGDGHADIITVNQQSADVSVMLGDGATNFALGGSRTFPNGCPANTSSEWLALGDFNGDRKPDLAITCWDETNYTTNGLVVRLNQSTPGSIAFAAPQNVNPENSQIDFIQVASADFNGDHKDDLAVSHYGLNNMPGALVVLLSKGDGTFSYDASKQRFAAESGAADVGTGDLNGDGLADILVATGGEFLLQLTSVAAAPGTFNVGKLGFDTTSNMGSIYFANQPLVADFNGDGKNDVAVVQHYSTPSGYEAIFLQDPTNGTFPGTPKSYPASHCPFLEATADFNCDGKADIVVASAGCDTSTMTFPREVAVMLQGVSSSFTEQNPTATIAEYGPQGIATADFNEDGLPDIVVGNGFDKYTVTVLITTPQ